MAAAYSYDLRKKAMEALDEGESIPGVDKVSRKSGSLGYNYKITDWNAFVEFAEEHGGKIQSDMAKP
ncbi:hypothetical protein DICVIV_13783 [Dictyocaulus viviparus]|uniref:Uncharacterized protein n=1 Tax=Dictyocaulus viviparus TaxID=29172 RepID=A0A0D8X958_DICVI|nr:hypothetical protein DICVIV_13783 [Dictyocaulus viviparus]